MPRSNSGMVATLLDPTVLHHHTVILVAMMQNLERCLRQLAVSTEELSARADAMCLQAAGKS